MTSVLASLGVLVVGWQAGLAGGFTSSTVTSGGNSVGTNTTGQTSGQTTSSISNSSSTVADGSYTGNDVNTRFGSVQVQISVSGGQISDVVALQLTDSDRRSIQISNRAAPVLRSEVLQSQSANVSNVSGATYTSDAYLQSLQSAIDQAGL